MGISGEKRRNIHVDESTWRKARVLAAAYGVPIYQIVIWALDEFAEAQLDKKVREVKRGDDVPREGTSSRSK